MDPRRLVLALATLATAVLLVVTSALADLRSSTGTNELGVTLADDPDVRDLVGTTIVDTLLEDAATAAPTVAPLLPLVRPALQGAVTTAIDAPAGRALLAGALAGTVQQLTFAGPIVLDLRDAVLAAAEQAPEPLDALARAAVERGAVGVVVLGEAPPDGVPTPRSAEELARIAGLDAGTATTLAWLLVAATLVVGLAPSRPGRSARLRTSGGVLLAVGAPVALLLRVAPARLVELLVGRSAGATATPGGGTSAQEELLAGVLPTLTDAVVTLLTRTATVATALTVAGAVLLLVGVVLPRVSGAGSPRGADRPART